MTKAVAKNSTIYVSRTIVKAGAPEQQEAGEEDVLAVHRFETEPAEVEVTMALTMNLGNYESARLSVSVRVPCYKEEVEEAYKFAERFVTEKVGAERDLIKANKSGTANPL